LVEICFGRIKKFNPTLDAFISIIEEDAQVAETKIKREKYLGPIIYQHYKSAQFEHIVLAILN
jgi:hypothetical protein